MISQLLSHPKLVATFAGLSSGEQQVVTALASAGTSIAGSKIADSVKLKEALGTIANGHPPPAWLAKLARTISALEQNPVLWAQVDPFLESLVERYGLDKESVSSLLTKMGSFLELDVSNRSLADQAKAIASNIQQRVDSADDPEAPNALVVCPQCQYAHGIRV